MGIRESQAKQGVGEGQFTSYAQRELEAGGGQVLYGLDKELAEKAAAKYDPQAEHQCRMWIEAVTGDQMGEASLQEELKTGIVLCNLVNIIKPGTIKAPSTSKMPFKQMENISMYLEGCTKLGVPSFSSFQTVSLYENKDMLAVLNNIQALGSVAQKVAGYSGPAFGTKIASSAPRDFTQEQLRKGATEQTFLGKGSQGFASQAGMGVGCGAEIVKCTDGGSAAPSMVNLGSTGCASSFSPDNSRNIVRQVPPSQRQSAPPSQLAAISGSIHSNTDSAKQLGTRRQTAAPAGGAAVFSKFSDNVNASGQVNYGMDKDLADKAAAKYDSGLEGECRAWIEAVTGEKLGECSLQEELKNGVVLCNLVNAIWPGASKAPSTSKMPFKQMENISMYLDASRKAGVSDFDQFQTVALFENKDMMAVLINIQSLGRVAQAAGYQGATLGAKLATANRRDFTEEQLAAGLHQTTFMGKGSHGGATQAGMIDRSKEINRTGHVSGLGHLGSTDATFLGTGSHGGATQAGMNRSHEIVRQQGGH